MAKEKPSAEAKELAILRAEIARKEKEFARAEKELASARSEHGKLIDGEKERSAALLEENRLLASKYANLETSYAHATALAAELREKLATLDKEHAALQTQAADLASQVKGMTAERSRLAARVAALEKQLRAAARAPILHAADVTALINGLIDDLNANLGAMALRDGELRLQVGFAGAGDAKGFVLPTVDGVSELTGPLQELLIRFERRTDLHLS